MKRPKAFTLIELLVVIAIVAILASVLFPVFSQAREKARQTTCLSGARQLGSALAMYTADYDERFPHGLGVAANKRLWAGEGWAGEVIPYVKSRKLFACPDDAGSGAVSYGYNINLVAIPDGEEDEEHLSPPPGISVAELESPSKTVSLFEVSGVEANLDAPREGADGGTPGKHYSASSNGLDNRLYAQRDWSTRTENQYATGYLGGRLPHDPRATQFSITQGRHHGGANYAFADGHTRWLRGERVSAGLVAQSATAPQDAPEFHAAGTACPDFSATFSIR